MTCNKCGRTSEEVEFYPSVKTRCKPCVKAVNDGWREQNPSYMAAYAKERRSVGRYKRDKHLLHRYGLTGEDFDAMMDAQGGCCKLCGNPPEPTRRHTTLVVDHCHLTGKVRGLLCNRCNLILGFIEQNPQALENIPDYLKGTHGLPLRPESGMRQEAALSDEGRS